MCFTLSGGIQFETWPQQTIVTEILHGFPQPLQAMPV